MPKGRHLHATSKGTSGVVSSGGAQVHGERLPRADGSDDSLRQATKVKDVLKTVCLCGRKYVEAPQEDVRAGRPAYCGKGDCVDPAQDLPVP